MICENMLSRKIGTAIPPQRFQYIFRQIARSNHEQASSIPKIKLNNNLEIPVLGLGTWNSKPGEVTQVIKDAIDIGYRYFDCAYMYLNEDDIGTGLRAKLDEGVVKREDLWITSKLWNTFHEPELVENALRTTLSNLKVDYLDLFLMHWPTGFQAGLDLFPLDDKGKILFSDVDYLDTWKAMEECVKKGLTKSIGISNFNSEQTERILKCGTIKPVTNQVECHPYLTQKKLGKFCRDRGIPLTAYSPFASPGSHYKQPEGPKLLENPMLKGIADKYKKSVGQILLRWQVQEGNIAIPKTVSKIRLEENLNIFDFEISREDMKNIDSLERNGRVCVDLRRVSHKYWPFHLEF